MAKPKLELKKKSDAQLSDFAQNHITSMTGNADFDSPVPPAPDMAAAKAAFDAALANQVAKEQAFRQAVVAKESARTELERLLTLRAGYVEAASGGDEAKILSSGFAVRSASAPVGSLPAPENLAATAGDNEGEIDLTWQPVTGAVSYEVDCRQHQEPPNWTRAKTVTSSKAELDGLTPGLPYAFRVRAVNAAGAGAWSDEAVRRAP